MRKPMTPDQRKKPLMLFVPPDLDARLRDAAEADERPLSQYLCRLLRTALATDPRPTGGQP